MFLLNSKKGTLVQGTIGPLIATIAENWPAKVISIAMAIILFTFHRMSLQEERFFSVPLGVETDTALVPAGPYPGMIKITLRGDANTIYPIQEDDIQAYIDLDKYTEPGTYRAPVRIHKKGTALRAETMEISVDPLEVTLVLDERLSKTVPVMATFRGALESGYELSEYTLDPAHVVIEGPAGLLIDVEELSTDFIELSGRSGDFSTPVRLTNPEPLLIIRGSGLIEFHGIVREQLRVQTFENLPLRIDNLADQFSGVLETGSGSVRIEGGQIMFNKIQAQDVKLSVDCSSIDGVGEFLLPVSAVFPPLFTLIRQDPEQVRIHILRRQPRNPGTGGS
jgi:YbbR domain-containing protein